MVLFPHYQPSHRLSGEPIRHTLQAGWVTCVLAAALLWAFWGETIPGYWTLLGIAAGTLMIVKGALELPQASPHRLRVAVRLSDSQDIWFPYLLFGAQTVYMVCLVALLWFALPALGVALNPYLHIGLFAVLALVTVRRLISEWAKHKALTERLPIQEVLQLSTVIIMTLLIAVAATHAISPFGHPITGDNTMPIVFIWIIAIFVILCCLILLIDRFTGRKRRKSD